MRFSASLAAALALTVACHGRGPAAGAFTPATLVGGQPAIPYPSDLFAKRISGDVMLYLVVDSTGAVMHDSTRITRKSGQDAFDAAALQAAADLHFAPAHRGGRPIASAIQVPIRFQLPDSLTASGKAHE